MAFTFRRPARQQLHSAVRRSLFVGLIAGSAFAGSSAQAASIQVPITGFTSAFDAVNWTPTTTGGGSASITGSTMTLGVPGTTTGATGQYLFNTSVLNTYAPSSGFTFKSGTLSFDWTWTFANGSSGTNYPFSYSVGTVTTGPIFTYNGGGTDNPANYVTSGTISGVSVSSADSQFGFKLNTTLGSPFFGAATATISNLTLNATYTDVPGPLPVAGAAAGFAWSRKLRRRLKTAQSVAA